MKTKHKFLVPAGSSALSSDVPWCSGFDPEALMRVARKRRTKKAPKGMPDVHTRFSLGQAVDFDRSDVVTEALRLAYVAGARDGAFESARVAELVAGEPVAWLVRFLANGTEGITACVVEETADKLAGLYSGTKTPLYAAPQPAAPAYGVEGEGEQFMALSVGGSFVSVLNTGETMGKVVGTRAQIERSIAARSVPKDWRAIRVIPADAPVVDVAKIREVIADLGASYPRLFASESAHLLRAAIGEKA